MNEKRRRDIYFYVAFIIIINLKLRKDLLSESNIISYRIKVILYYIYLTTIEQLF